MAQNKKFLTKAEEDKLIKILNEDSSIWTPKGYDSGILCEDAETKPIIFSKKAERDRRVMEKLIETQAQVNLIKSENALKIALSNFDDNVIQEAKELQKKYDALTKSRLELKEEVENYEDEISELRKKRTYLKSQKKKLEAAVNYLENHVLAKLVKTVETIESKVESMGAIQDLEV